MLLLPMTWSVMRRGGGTWCLLQTGRWFLLPGSQLQIPRLGDQDSATTTQETGVSNPVLVVHVGLSGEGSSASVQ